VRAFHEDRPALEFFKRLFSSDFLPHGTCYLWNQKIVWLHVVSDSVITLAYYCIPIALIYLVHKRRDLPFNWIFWMFGLFILGCGTTHLMEVWNVWHGSYLIAGIIKAVTGVASLATAIVLIPLLPKVISLPAQMQLQEANRKLAVEITEREQATEARERLAAVVESSEDAIVSKNLNGTITAWNPGAERLFGYSTSEAVGKSMRMLLPAERANEEGDILDRIGRGERVEHFETIRVRKDGGKIDVSVTISPIKDSHGVIVGASNIDRDISERRRSDQALTDSVTIRERMLKELADQKFALDQHAIVAITDVQGTITYVNEKFCAISKYSKEELLGQNHRILNSGHHSKEFFQHMYRTIAAGKVWHDEIRNRAKDGSIYWVDTTIVPFVAADGKPRQYVAIRTDITERKRAEQALKESLITSEAALKELADQRFALDQHADVTITDIEGRITYANDRFCALSQYSRDELIGQNHRILNSGHHSKEFFQQIYKTITRGEVWRGEIKNRRKDGTTYWTDATIVPFLGRAGKPRQYVAIRADITERKVAGESLAVQALELIRQAEQRKADEQEILKLNNELEERVIQRTAQLEAANKELEAFTYSVSHDLRAPLRHIVGFSKMLSETCGTSLPSEGRHYLERIQTGTHRMGMLVDDLLKLTRIGRHELEMQVTSLDAMVKDVIAELTLDTGGREIEWKIGDLPLVKGDPALIKVVIQNLLANAVKYTRTRAKAIIEIGTRQNALYIRDNGVGFDMKYADKLFGAFQRLHRSEDFEGTGVGLAIVQRVVQKHGGRIWAEAEPEIGATFYLSLGMVPEMPVNNGPTTAEKAHDYAR
jgi:PAS domain S-box-containing protein